MSHERYTGKEMCMRKFSSVEDPSYRITTSHDGDLL